MIEKIVLINVKSHRRTELHLDSSRLHAIVGPNSSGKTSVLQAMYYLSHLARHSDEINNRYKTLPQSLAREDCRVFGLDVCGVAQVFKGKGREQEFWQIVYKWEKSWDNSINEEVAWWIDKGKRTVLPTNGIFTAEAPSSIVNALGQVTYLNLVVENLSQSAYSDRLMPRLEPNGFGFAPMLDFIRNERLEKFKHLQEKLKQVTPQVREVGIRRAKVQSDRKRSIEVDGKAIAYDDTQEIIGQEVVIDMQSGDRLPASAVSEGTMLALGILTVLVNSDSANLVLLDDIEKGLHPKAQRELIAVFKDLLAENPELQIIFTTHSPYIIDELAPSQVHVLNLTKQGFSACKRLDEHPDAELATQVLTTGEFWDAEGEDWVTEGEEGA